MPSSRSSAPPSIPPTRSQNKGGVANVPSSTKNHRVLKVKPTPPPMASRTGAESKHKSPPPPKSNTATRVSKPTPTPKISSQDARLLARLDSRPGHTVIVKPSKKQTTPQTTPILEKLHDSTLTSSSSTFIRAVGTADEETPPDALLLPSDIWMRTKTPLNYNMVLTYQVRWENVPTASSVPVSAYGKPLEATKPSLTASPGDGFLQRMRVCRDRTTPPEEAPFSLYMSTEDWVGGGAELIVKYFKEGNASYFAETRINLSRQLEVWREGAQVTGQGRGWDGVLGGKGVITSVRRSLKIGSFKFRMVFGDGGNSGGDEDPEIYLLNKILRHEETDRAEREVAAREGDLKMGRALLEAEQEVKDKARRREMTVTLDQSHSELLSGLELQFPGLVVPPEPPEEEEDEDEDRSDNWDDTGGDEQEEEKGSQMTPRPSQGKVVTGSSDFIDVPTDYTLTSGGQAEEEEEEVGSGNNNTAAEQEEDERLLDSSRALIQRLQDAMKTEVDSKSKSKRVGVAQNVEATQKMTAEAAVLPPFRPGLTAIHQGLEEKVAALAGQVSSYSSKLLETETELMGLRSEVASLRQERQRHLTLLENSCEKIDSLKASLAMALSEGKDSAYNKAQIPLLEGMLIKLERVGRIIHVLTSGDSSSSSHRISSEVLEQLERSLGLDPITTPPPTPPTGELFPPHK